MSYLILSLPVQGDMLLWWRPKNAGYTVRFDEAGRYSREEVEADPDYYNNHKTTMAVPQSAVFEVTERIVANESTIVAQLKKAAGMAFPKKRAAARSS